MDSWADQPQDPDPFIVDISKATDDGDGITGPSPSTLTPQCVHHGSVPRRSLARRVPAISTLQHSRAGHPTAGRSVIVTMRGGPSIIPESMLCSAGSEPFNPQETQTVANRNPSLPLDNLSLKVYKNTGVLATVSSTFTLRLRIDTD
eukprot:m.396679 g.396679  ORF g.396679 m.396679 type:complete len:147 (-) comp16772_c1_seq52:2338-2778(-)